MANQPASWTSLLSSVAAVLQAIAWPVAITLLFVIYRSKIGSVLDVLTNKLATATKLKVWQLELESKEQAVKEVLDETGKHASGGVQREIPERQIKAAGEVNRLLRDGRLSERRANEVAQRQLDYLCGEYERIRKEMPSSSSLRTRMMNEVAAKMRALALASRSLLRSLASGDSSGEHLAAICILQVAPEGEYLPWLIERIKNESQPFIFFQAAVAVLNLVKARAYSDKSEASEGIKNALHRISSFKGGPPDQNTIDVLSLALSALDERGSRMAHV